MFIIFVFLFYNLNTNNSAGSHFLLSLNLHAEGKIDVIEGCESLW